MDAYEATQVVFARVQAQDPENVSKIIGFLLLQDRSEQYMARLAMGSDGLLQSAIAKARRELGISSSEFDHHHHHQQQQQQQRIHSPSSRPSPLFIPDFSGSNSSSGNSSPIFNPQSCADDSSSSSSSSSAAAAAAVEQLYPLSRFHHQATAAAIAANKKLLQHHDLAVALAWKPCLYYSRGYCKHGTSCRFLHGSSSSSGNSSPLEGISSPAAAAACSHHHSCASSSSPFFEEIHEHLSSHFPAASSSSCSSSSPPPSCSSSSLERLEMELQELLRGRRTPISIASLPQLYYEKFGKALQAQGYLTESQRHGKAGCSLTKLLARLKGSVALIDRPHGQHALVLAEDAQRFVGYRADRDDLKDVNPSSRQIYLTFPAESTFTEDDVSAHFRAYGPVQDVRIPFQQKRMFGFVTFVYSETVKTILCEGNPHYICGARVLVKPYREKAKLSERKQGEKMDPARGSPQFRSLQDGSFFDAFARTMDEERLLELQERRRMMDFHRLESLRARAAEVEATAKLMIMEDQQQQELRSINCSSPSSILNGIRHHHHHQRVDSSPELPRTPQMSEHSNSSSSHGGLNDANDTTLTSEDMQQFQSSNPFGFVMDVLDSEEVEGSGGDIKTESLKIDLPENPFTSTPEEEISKALLLPQSSPDDFLSTFTLQEKMMAMNLNQVLGMAIPQHNSSNNTIICCICLQHCVEPSRLECSHTFCVQCILKVIRGSKDECPICRQHIGSQVYKILQNRDLQSWLSPTLSHRVPQHIW